MKKFKKDKEEIQMKNDQEEIQTKVKKFKGFDIIPSPTSTDKLRVIGNPRFQPNLSIKMVVDFITAPNGGKCSPSLSTSTVFFSKVRARGWDELQSAAVI